MTTVAHKFAVYITLVLASLLAGGSLLLFMLFLFHGSLSMVNLGLSETATLWFDVGLCLAFFVQHSSMVRRSFSQRLARFFPKAYGGVLYAIASGIVLLILILFWQESGHTLTAPQGIIRWLLRGIFFLSIAGMVWGIRALGTFDPFGLKSIQNRLRSTEPSPMPLTVRGPYRWVRHPLYLFNLLLIWSYPDLTTDRLLFNGLWTAWITVGSVLEERDLVADFGEAYRDYQRKVPMLIPYRVRPAERVGHTTK